MVKVSRDGSTHAAPVISVVAAPLAVKVPIRRTGDITGEKLHPRERIRAVSPEFCRVRIDKSRPPWGDEATMTVVVAHFLRKRPAGGAQFLRRPTSSRFENDEHPSNFRASLLARRPPY